MNCSEYAEFRDEMRVSYEEPVTAESAAKIDASGKMSFACEHPEDLAVLRSAYLQAESAWKSDAEASGFEIVGVAFEARERSLEFASAALDHEQCADALWALRLHYSS